MKYGNKKKPAKKVTYKDVPGRGMARKAAKSLQEAPSRLERRLRAAGA